MALVTYVDLDSATTDYSTIPSSTTPAVRIEFAVPSGEHTSYCLVYSGADYAPVRAHLEDVIRYLSPMPALILPPKKEAHP